MTTGTGPLTNPASLFTFDSAFLPNGRLALDIWVKWPSGDTRGVIDAAMEITLDSNDASLASGVPNYTLPAGWTGIVGGSSKIILAMFNSTESAPGSGQQVYVQPVFETTGKHAGEQKLASLVLDVKPLVTDISPIKVVVATFTDSLGFSYPGSGGITAPISLEVNVALPGLQIVPVTGDNAPNELDASVATRAFLFGEGGNDTGIKLASGDAFIGGPGTDLARILGEQSSYLVKLASSGLESALRNAIPSSSTGALESGVPLFAISSTTSSSLPILVQAESLQFGAAPTSIHPLRLLNTSGPAKFVDANDPQAFANIGLALAAAAAGDTVVVSPAHREFNAAVLEVRVNDVRVLLLNPDAEPLTFRLAESATVTRFTLLGNGPANVVGNSHANLLVGNDASNLIDGMGANDTVIGGGGDDEVYGGAGADWLDGGEGWDTVSGGSGNDVLLAVDGGHSDGTFAQREAWQTDVLMGGSGADVLMASGAEQSGGVRMLGGSGADLYRLMSVAGADGNLEPEAQSYRVHIADLSINDGLDLSAFAAGSTLQPDFGASILSGRFSLITTNVLNAPSGDARISLGNLVVQGLSSGAGTGAGGPAPFAPVASASELIVSMVAGEADIFSALNRGDSLQSIPGAASSRSVQELADSVLPVYFSHEQLLSQLVMDLAP